MRTVEPPAALEPVTVAGLAPLLEPRTGPCVSLHLGRHPAEPSGVDQPIDPARLGALLRDARDQLHRIGTSRSVGDRLLAPARALLDDAAFWSRPAGAVLLLAEGLAVRASVPGPLEELAVVGPSFQLLPLLSLAADDRALWLLELDEEHVRLYEVTLQGMRELVVDGLPRTMDEALGTASSGEHMHLQVGLARVSASGGVGYAGPAPIAEDHDADLVRFFRVVDRAVCAAMPDGGVPLLLAGAAYHLPIYRSVSRHAMVRDEHVVVGPEDRRPRDLHRRALTVLRSMGDEVRAEAARRYADRLTHGGTASTLDDVLLAGAQGRVHTLLVRRSAHVWGGVAAATASDGTLTLEVHDEQGAGDVDLLDEASVRVARTGGAVLLCDAAAMPVPESPLAAVLRW